MQNKSLLLTLNIFFVILFISACAPQNVHDGHIPEAGSNNTGAGNYNNNGNTNNTSNNTYGLPAQGRYNPSDLENPSSILSKRIIYFSYDSAYIDTQYIPIVEAHASLLANHPNLYVRLEGHADERASREYNIALSERRAKTVQQLMTSNGTKQGQTQVIAYGEEMPVEEGHSERAWSKNRRVEIKYIGR